MFLQVISCLAQTGEWDFKLGMNIISEHHTCVVISVLIRFLIVAMDGGC